MIPTLTDGFSTFSSITIQPSSNLQQFSSGIIQDQSFCNYFYSSSAYNIPLENTYITEYHQEKQYHNSSEIDFTLDIRKCTFCIRWIYNQSHSEIHSIHIHNHY